MRGLVYPKESYRIMGACFGIYKEKGAWVFGRGLSGVFRN